MANIVPLRGVRYNQDQVGDLRELTTPPYDVIGPEEQDMYYRRHENNVIRLELGKTDPTDDDNNNRYTRAASYLKDWLEKGVLQKDEQPALYLYEQEFLDDGKPVVRTGFICGVQLADYGERVVLPHEQTLAKPKADRLQLMNNCFANFSSIFGLYRDEQNRIGDVFAQAKEGKQSISFTDDNRVTHRLWIVDEPAVVEQVQNLMNDKPIYIADGHHRYETALHFKNQMEAQGKTGYDYVMMTLVNVYDPGLVVYPTHRLVNNVENFSPDKLVAQLEQDFEVRWIQKTTLQDDIKGRVDRFTELIEGEGQQAQVLAMAFPDGRVYVLKRKAKENPPETAADQLDVTLLQQDILEKYLGIGVGERERESNLTYVRDGEYALRAVLEGQYQVGFFLNPTKVTEVTDVADEGGIMPQKSTYFYPKLVTGLVMNCF